ncbi:hypothetical protein [Actinomadura soli]|uniref:hypothetical protein n=1 Tax=Actinomadura soli TaxID=2508997 RepID=UPI0014865B6E|nr:hypothetical protein [Actinomadura soli]
MLDLRERVTVTETPQRAMLNHTAGRPGMELVARYRSAQARNGSAMAVNGCGCR